MVNCIRIFNAKMAGGDKLLEDFVLIAILTKEDAIEYMVPQSVRLLRSSHTSFSILTQSCSAIS